MECFSGISEIYQHMFSYHIRPIFIKTTISLHILAHTQAFVLCGKQSVGCWLEQIVVLCATTLYVLLNNTSYCWFSLFLSFASATISKNPLCWPSNISDKQKCLSVIYYYNTVYCVSRVESKLSAMYSPVWLGPSWEVPDPDDGSLRLLALADSGPETQPEEI